jgi:hypothetical protein
MEKLILAQFREILAKLDKKKISMSKAVELINNYIQPPIDCDKCVNQKTLNGCEDCKEGYSRFKPIIDHFVGVNRMIDGDFIQEQIKKGNYHSHPLKEPVCKCDYCKYDGQDRSLDPCECCNGEDGWEAIDPARLTAEEILEETMRCTIDDDADLDNPENFYFKYNDVLQAMKIYSSQEVEANEEKWREKIQAKIKELKASRKCDDESLSVITLKYLLK